MKNVDTTDENGIGTDREGAEIAQLKEIRQELTAIKDRTANPKRMFVNGVLYGAGAFVGGVAAVAAVGWLLSFLGVIPGLGDLAGYVQDAVSRIER